MLALPQAEVDQCRDAILQAEAWVLGDERFASGATANNKLVLDKVLDHPEARETVIHSFGKLVMRLEPDVLWGPPEGGQAFAIALGEHLDLRIVRLKKVSVEPGRKTFTYASEKDRERLEKADSAAGIEDATSELTTLSGALELDLLEKKTFGIVSLWRRGLPEQERALGKRMQWVIEQHIPNHITPEDPFFKAFGHLAVRQGE